METVRDIAAFASIVGLAIGFIVVWFATTAKRAVKDTKQFIYSANIENDLEILRKNVEKIEVQIPAGDRSFLRYLYNEIYKDLIIFRTKWQALLENPANFNVMELNLEILIETIDSGQEIALSDDEKQKCTSLTSQIIKNILISLGLEQKARL